MHKLFGVFAVGAIALVSACSSSASHPNASGSPSNSPGATSSAGASANPSTAASAPASGTPAPTATPAAGHTVGTGPGSKPPGRPTGFTRAGTYDYDLTGTTTTRLGAQKISGSDSLAVDPPKGSQQKTTQKNQQGSRNQTLNLTSGGLFILDIHITQGSFNEDFKPVGTAMYFPANYKVGSAWHWVARSTDGKYTLDTSSKITSSTTIVVHGQTLPVLVVDSVVKFTGNSYDLTEQQRDWVSTAYALIVKEHLVTHGTIAGFKLDADETRTIRSTTPRSG